MDQSHREGDVICNKYRLVRLLGQGGMGSVWLARNLTLEVDVAVKLIRDDIGTPEAAWRLLQEARAAARLGHASIVRLFDFGTTDQGEPFIVMELLQGESLGQMLDRKNHLDPIRAVRTLLPVASALDAAHEKGIIHRDLKPDNIIVSRNEIGVLVPKVVDFGLAKLHRRDAATGRSTQRGVVLGSPGYMSPEQASGNMDVDRRTDIWAFSVVLYEALTGNHPFGERNYNTLLAAVIAHDPIPIRVYGIDDKVLWAALEKGLAKNRAERWQTMRELGTALALWLVARGIETDVAGNSLAAHWTRLDEHRPNSVVERAPVRPSQASTQSMDAPQLRLDGQPKEHAQDSRTLSGNGRAEHSHGENFSSSLTPRKKKAPFRSGTGAVAQRPRSVARLWTVPALVVVVLFFGGWVGTYLPPPVPAAPRPRAKTTTVVPRPAPRGPKTPVPSVRNSATPAPPTPSNSPLPSALPSEVTHRAAPSVQPHTPPATAPHDAVSAPRSASPMPRSTAPVPMPVPMPVPTEPDF